MTGPFEGLSPARFALAGEGARPPRPANDNQPGTKGAQGFHGLLLRRDGEKYEILLCHREPGLSQRVETVDDDVDVIALWRGIGRKLNLPLFAETADGEIVQMEPMPCLVAAPRRYGSPLSGRRPRFLACRKMGAPRPDAKTRAGAQRAL
ncbi:MAG TPA: DUF6101 family protein [Beijerinckiaceae bacterium]|nr:DUF6101 family protein [Beijerinckiaceae bacterium]